MPQSPYTSPLLTRDGQGPVLLERVELSGTTRAYDEAYIQHLAFEHPRLLPVAELDRAYEGPVPVCMELPLPSGYLDALYVTRTGRLVLAESKLWRNPEARRKVVSQILDYAKDFAAWGYDDLQRAVSSRLGQKGNVLFDIVKSVYPDTDEARFCDEVERSLRSGRFLLLIIGDGIREGAGAIAGFLEDVGSLEFSFGLVELALYRNPLGDELLVQPRVLAKTVIINHSVVTLSDGLVLREAEQPGEIRGEEELSESEKFYLGFWREFTQSLTLDDPSQRIPSTTKIQNLYFSLPPSGSATWLNVFVSRSRQSVGVSLAFAKGAFADIAYAALEADRDDIDKLLGAGVEWKSDGERHRIRIERSFADVWSETERPAIYGFLAEWVNRFVTVLRPRLERIVAELDR